MHSSFMDFDFGKIHYLHCSADKKKTLLFLHSFNSSAASFSVVCELLKNQFNLYCLDFPGHGLTPHLDVRKYSQYYSVSGLTAVLIEFVERLKLKNLYILGNSMGGNAAVRAVPSLEVIEGLILMGSIQAKTKESLFNIMFPTAPLEVLFKPELSDQEIEVLTRAYVYESKEAQEAFKQMSHDIRSTDSKFREYFGRNLETQEWVDEIQILKNRAIPFLYILGLNDGFINSQFYKKLLLEEGFPESQIKIVDQAGHAVHLSKPHLCAKLIAEFIYGDHSVENSS